MAVAEARLNADALLGEASAPLTALKYARLAPLAFILVSGLGLRLWGVTFGLPFDYHVDEPAYVSPAWVLGQGDVDPLLTPLSMLVFLEHTALVVLERATGFVGLAGLPIDGKAAYVLMARTTSALLGSATAIPLYLLGRQWWGEVTGLLAALIYSLSFLPVRDAHYGAPDVVGAFFVLMSVYFSTRLSMASPRYYALAGVTAGVAIAARPQTALLLIPAILFHLSPGNQTDRLSMPAFGDLWMHVRTWTHLRAMLVCRNAALYVVGSSAAFALSAPAALIHPLAYARMIHSQMLLSRLGGFGRFQVIDSSGWVFYLESLRWGLGDVALALALFGSAWILIQRWRGPLFLYIFPIISFVSMGATPHAMVRYLLPICPFLALAAAVGIVRLVSMLPNSGTSMAYVGVVGLACVTVSQPVQAVVLHDQLLTTTDTRTLARDWIEANLPDGALITEEWYTPVLADERSDMAPGERRFKVRGTSVFGLSDDPAGSRAGARTLLDYRAQGVQYLIASSFSWRTRMLDQQEETRKHDFYQSLDSDAQLVAEFTPYRSGVVEPPFIFDDIYGPAASEFDLERPGPVIKIYRIQPN